MTTLKDVQEWIDSAYDYPFIAIYDLGDYIRITDGSDMHYIDIRIHDGRFTLQGERYGHRIQTDCEATEDALLETLRSVV